MLKYSRQRESIKEFLLSSHTHPTADTVYSETRKQFPNISLGTVYRNLSLLASTGEIRRITCGDGADRFDADIHPHYHFLCDRCGCLEDMPMEPIGGLNELAKNFYQGRISGHQTYFHGVCPKCLKKEEGLKKDAKKEQEKA